MRDHAGASVEERPFTWRRGAKLVFAIAAWAWFIVAGCGGLGLIIERGPWPPTHGWFAMFSGLAAWPVTAWPSKKYLGVALSGPVRLGAAALFILAGRLALIFLWPPPRTRSRKCSQGVANTSPFMHEPVGFGRRDDDMRKQSRCHPRLSCIITCHAT